MGQSKKGFLPVLQGVKLSKTQCPTTAEDREKMKDVPYASAIGSIMYAMLCTRPDVCLAISLAGRYQSNPGVDHWSLHTFLAPLGSTKPSGCIIYNSS